MGECFIIKKGGSSRLPVLDNSFPADGESTYAYGATNKHTFEVKIAIKGAPDRYSYQWYVNDSPIAGATGTTYEYTTTYAGKVRVFCRVSNDAGYVDSKVAILLVTTTMTYLFNSKDNTALTGGWSLMAIWANGNNNSGAPTDKISSNVGSTLTLNGTGGGWSGQWNYGHLSHNNSINTNGAGKLYIKFENLTITGDGGDSGNPPLAISIDGNWSVNGSSSFVKTFLSPTTKTDYILDIDISATTSLKLLFYTELWFGNQDKTDSINMSIDKIWMQ